MIHILLNNGPLEFVNIEQQEASYIPYGVEFKNPSFAAVAEAMGVKGIRIEEPDVVHKSGPVVVDFVVDPYALGLPSHVPFHTMKGYTLSIAKQVLSDRMDDLINTLEHNVSCAPRSGLATSWASRESSHSPTHFERIALGRGDLDFPPHAVE